MKWQQWFRRKDPPKPELQLASTDCPRCGRKMVFVEKFTMLGDDQRTYLCESCRKEHVLNFGTALWKLMSDANREERQK
jgi:transposase-like protein